jgi:C4-dicarboxylate-specific signal transduction histidine kinase
MLDEVRRRAFEPFFTTKGPGLGSGLAIVHEIVRHRGGFIVVKSAVSRGTEVAIYLPGAEAGG